MIAVLLIVLAWIAIPVLVAGIIFLLAVIGCPSSDDEDSKQDGSDDVASLPASVSAEDQHDDGLRQFFPRPSRMLVPFTLMFLVCLLPSALDGNPASALFFVGCVFLLVTLRLRIRRDKSSQCCEKE